MFLCSSRGINGKEKCNITLSYDNISNEDIMTVYNYLLDEIIIKKPSLVGVKNSNVEIIDNVININVMNDFEKDDLVKEKKNFLKNLNKYGINLDDINIIVNDGLRLEIKE